MDQIRHSVCEARGRAESLREIGEFSESYRQKNTLHGFLDKVKLTWM